MDCNKLSFSVTLRIPASGRCFVPQALLSTLLRVVSTLPSSSLLGTSASNSLSAFPRPRKSRIANGLSTSFILRGMCESPVLRKRKLSSLILGLPMQSERTKLNKRPSRWCMSLVFVIVQMGKRMNTLKIVARKRLWIVHIHSA